MISSASNPTPEPIRSLTVAQFAAQQGTLACAFCQAIGTLTSTHVSTNNGLRLDCGACGKTHALGRTLFLLQSGKAKRKAYPFGKDLDDVWAEFANVCVVCGAPKDFLDREGIRRERHHILAYAAHGHEGPLVPMCGPCHANTTERQKLFWFWYRRAGGQP